ncbi:MAG: pyruvate kinase, partial [Rhodobacteraceae bacterium]
MLRTSRERSVKIVATLGPASDSAKTIRELFIAGADVFRLNLSHGNHSELKERYQIIRELEKELGRPIGILADLQGPKLRCGDFENGYEELVEGSSFIFDLEEKLGNKNRVMLPHQEIFEVLKVGSVILVDDGKIKLEVIEAARDQI